MQGDICREGSAGCEHEIFTAVLILVMTVLNWVLDVSAFCTVHLLLLRFFSFSPPTPNPSFQLLSLSSSP